MQFREMRGEDRLRLGKENKNFVFCFAFRSPCITLASPKIGCGSGKQNKTSFSFGFSLALHYFATARRR